MPLQSAPVELGQLLAGHPEIFAKGGDEGHGHVLLRLQNRRESSRIHGANAEVVESSKGERTDKTSLWLQPHHSYDCAVIVGGLNTA